MKRAIIIGASSGIGFEISKLLLADGWNIGVAARRTNRLESLKSMSPTTVETEYLDITSDDSSSRILSLIDRLGGIDLFIQASGIGKQNRDLNQQIEIDTIRTNTLGFTRVITTVFNYMSKNSGGHIAVISSIAGTKGLGPAPSYSASKAFQSTYIQALEQLSNMRHLNIKFTDIRPGFVDTDLLSDDHYPMLMDKTNVAKEIIRAIHANKHISIIDWRWRITTFLWRIMPRYIWRKIKL